MQREFENYENHVRCSVRCVTKIKKISITRRKVGVIFFPVSVYDRSIAGGRSGELGGGSVRERTGWALFSTYTKHSARGELADTSLYLEHSLKTVATFQFQEFEYRYTCAQKY